MKIIVQNEGQGSVSAESILQLEYWRIDVLKTNVQLCLYEVKEVDLYVSMKLLNTNVQLWLYEAKQVDLYVSLAGAHWASLSIGEQALMSQAATNVNLWVGAE